MLQLPGMLVEAIHGNSADTTRVKVKTDANLTTEEYDFAVSLSHGFARCCTIFLAPVACCFLNVRLVRWHRGWPKPEVTNDGVLPNINDH